MRPLIDYALFSRGARAVPYLSSALFCEPATHSQIVNYSLVFMRSMSARIFSSALASHTLFKGLFSQSKPLDAALDNDISPGNCVSFQANSKAYYTFTISDQSDAFLTTLPSHVSLRHPAAQALANRTSAVRRFKFYALVESSAAKQPSLSSKALLLGSFEHPNDDYLDTHYFKLKSSSLHMPEKYFISGYQMVIESNWGHDKYTCLYKLSLHFNESDASFFPYDPVLSE